MSFILRFTQQYQPSANRAFFELEAQFQKLERSVPQLPIGRRSQPLSGVMPTNTLVWECEFPSLADVQDALKKIAEDPTHTKLFEKQAVYIIEARTEIYEVLDL